MPGGGSPTVTGVSPNSGPQAGGTSVTITGSNYSGVASVQFGTSPAAFFVVNSTTIMATSPAGTGIVDITVTTGTPPLTHTSATSSSDLFYYIIAGSAALVCNSTVTAILTGITKLKATSTLTAMAVILGPVFGSCNLITSSILPTVGNCTFGGITHLKPTSALLTKGNADFNGIALLQSTSTLKSKGYYIFAGQALLSSTSKITAKGSEIGDSHLQLMSTLTAIATVGFDGTAALTSSSLMQATPLPVTYIQNWDISTSGWMLASPLAVVANANAVSSPNILLLNTSASVGSLFAASNLINDQNSGDVNVQACFIGYDPDDLSGGSDIRCGVWCRGTTFEGVDWGTSYTADLDRNTITLVRWVEGTGTILSSVEISGGLLGSTWYLLSITANGTTISVSLSGAFGQVGPNVNFSYAYDPAGTLMPSPQTCIAVIDNDITGKGTFGLYMGRSDVASPSQEVMSDNLALYTANSINLVVNSTLSASSNTFKAITLASKSILTASASTSRVLVDYVVTSTLSGLGNVNYSGAAALSPQSLVSANVLLVQASSSGLSSTSHLTATGINFLIATISQNSPTSPPGIAFSIIVNFSNGSVQLRNVTGQVTFYNNNVAVGTASIDATGIATWIFSNLPIGVHVLYAEYLGNTNYLPLQTPPIVHDVTSAINMAGAQQAKLHRVIDFVSSIPTDPSTSQSYMTTWGGVSVGGAATYHTVFSPTEPVSGVVVGGSAIITQNFDILGISCSLIATGMIIHHGQGSFVNNISLQATGAIFCIAQTNLNGNISIQANASVFNTILGESLLFATGKLIHNAQAGLLSSSQITVIFPTTLTLSGPSQGPLQSWGQFLVTPTSSFVGVVTPSDSSHGGTFDPTTLTFSNSAAPQSFKYTPPLSQTTPTTIPISITSLPVNTYAGTPIEYMVEISLLLYAPTTGSVGVGSSLIVYPTTLWNGLVTFSDNGSGGIFNPPSLYFVTTNNLPQTSTYTPSHTGVIELNLTSTIAVPAVGLYLNGNTHLSLPVAFTVS